MRMRLGVFVTAGAGQFVLVAGPAGRAPSRGRRAEEGNHPMFIGIGTLVVIVIIVLVILVLRR
jgi:hypothetical protein